MRDSGKASKSAMQGVIKNINDYTTIVQNELNLIMKEADSLSDIWMDNKYKQFIGCVERMKASVELELQTMNNARYELEKKVGIM